MLIVIKNSRYVKGHTYIIHLNYLTLTSTQISVKTTKMLQSRDKLLMQTFSQHTQTQFSTSNIAWFSYKISCASENFFQFSEDYEFIQHWMRNSEQQKLSELSCLKTSKFWINWMAYLWVSLYCRIHGNIEN